jgi:hypothetical protein
VETAWIQDLRLWLGEDISFDILVDSVSDQANWLIGTGGYVKPIPTSL